MTWIPFPGAQEEFCSRGEFEILYGGQAGGGKGLLDGTPVATPFGNRRIESLQVGDTVLNVEGGHSKVIGVYPQGVQQLYRFTFQDGVQLVTDKSHRFQYSLDSHWKLDTAESMYQRFDAGSQFMIPLCEPLEFTPSHEDTKNNKTPYQFGQTCAGRRTYIPDCYKWGSIENRWSLLHGLLDSKGSSNILGNRYYVCPSNRLAHDVAYLVRTLGGMAHITVIDDIDLIYTVHITLPGATELKRKITNIEKIGFGRTTCIAIDHVTSLFVAGEGCVVSHNSDCLIALATRNVGNPKYSGLILRRTFPQLQEIIDRCHEMYPTLGGVYKATEHRWYFASGAKITLGHMQHENDKYNYQGKEFQFVGFDELTHFSETQYRYLFSRCRSTIPGLSALIRCTTNPGGVGHLWVKERFIDNCEPHETYIDPESGLSRVFIPGKLTDNPALMDNDPGYSRRLDGLPEIERMRLKEGIWDAFEGQVFSELSHRVHSIEPFEPDPDWYKFMVFDWGFTAPFAVLWFALDFDGTLYLYREWYGSKSGNIGLKASTGDIISGIREREFEHINARVADPAIWSKTPNKHKLGIKGPSVNEDFQNAGMFLLKADNDRVQGKNQVHRRFEIETETDPKTGEILSERPRFYATKDCEHFWRTLPQIREDRKNPEDTDTDGEDHIYDCLRYGCMFRPIKPKRHNMAPEGTFSTERKRLLRARKYAQTRGVSLEQAYRRIK